LETGASISRPPKRGIAPVQIFQTKAMAHAERGGERIRQRFRIRIEVLRSKGISLCLPWLGHRQFQQSSQEGINLGLPFRLFCNAAQLLIAPLPVLTFSRLITISRASQ